MGILKKVMPIATILAVFMSMLTPATPAHAWPPQTWNTQAAFSSGLLVNVDNITSPNNILLATNLDNGDGSDGSRDISSFYLIDFSDARAAAVTHSSYINSSYIYVNPTSAFNNGDEVLIIQMTGTGAGTWETNYIAGVESTLLVFTRLLKNAYYADANSQAQVIRVPHYTDVTIKSGGLLTCYPWNPTSSTGGVIFFRATGAVTVESGGVIEASGCGFQGGSGGTQGGGSGGQGGAKGDKNTGNGYDGAVNGGGGKGGNPGFCIEHGWGGGDGGYQGYGGASGQQGTAGGGPGGGASDLGGANGSTASLSLMQAGGGGGGGSSGRQGYGGGGGGGGGLNACVLTIGGQNGKSGNSGGSPGSGGSGGLGAGIIAIHAKNIVANQANQITAQGQTTSAAAGAGGTGGSGGAGGCGENFCGQYVDGNWQSFGAGGGGGGGNGGGGGGGGNGCGGGSGGTIWLAANNINLATNGASALGGTGGAGGQGGSGGSGGAGGCGGSGDDGCNGQSGSNGAGGATGPAGPTGGKGGAGAVRLDYISLSGSTTPAPGYTSGLYYASGTIASNVWHDTDTPSENWSFLSWQETVPSGTDITFEARASDSSFGASDLGPAWKSVGGTSPVTSGLPSGRYMQWRATLTTTNSFYTPVLHSVTAASSLLPIVATNAATNIASNGAVMNGTLSSLGQRSGTVYVSFQYGTSANPDSNWQYSNSIPLTAPGLYSIGLNPLSPGTTYYYRARAFDLDVHNPVFGGVVSFSTSYVSPSVRTNAAGSVTSGSAVLNGYLDAKGSSPTVNVSFLWGTTQGGPYPNTITAPAMTSTGPFPASLSGLGGNTTYYYRAKADGGASGASYGSETSFTTLPAAPSVATGDASAITSNSATLNGSLANLGSAATVNVSLQWGTTQGGPYPNTITAPAMTSTGPFSAGLSGLSAKTTYYFRAKADGGLSGISYGTENSFTTSVVQPTVVTKGATGITSTSALLNGNLTAMGTAATVNVAFYYGLQPGEFNHTAWQTLGAPGSFQASLAGLTPDTLYYFRSEAQGDGNSVDGAELTFRTSRVPPTVTTNGVTTPVGITTATLNGTLTGIGSAASDNVSFQWGTVPGMYSMETDPQVMFDPSPFHAGLSDLASAKTYYYRAKANGGIDGIGYGDEHSFTTGSQPPSATTNNASQLTTHSAMLNGSLDGKGSADIVSVSFQWGTTQGGPYPNSTSAQPASTGPFQAGLSGLASRTTYYYRARADGGIFGTGYGAEKSFSTSSFPPYVTTGHASGISDSAATLNGNLYFMGSAGTVNVYFVYGTTHNGPYTSTTPLQPFSATTPFTALLSELNSPTTYYYRAMGNGGQYGTSRGEEYAFTTLATPPTVLTEGAGGVTASAAILNGNLSELGTATSVDVSFQYGTTAGGPYPVSTTPQAKATPVHFPANISSLDANTTYYFRAKADGGINGISYGSEMSFTTLTVAPSVATDNATNITAVSATLKGSLTSLGSASTVKVYFSYGTDENSYSENTTQQSMAGQGLFQANIIGLSALTTYYYSAAADGGVNGSAQGVQCSFTTGATPPSVATGSATKITDTSYTLHGTLEAKGTSPTDNVSFQWGRQPGVYDNQTALLTMSDPGPFHADLSGLMGATTYYYRAVASGGRHGSSFGNEHAFTTGSSPPSVVTSAATDIWKNVATLKGNLTDLGTAKPVNVSFIYGTTQNGPYPYATALQAMSAPDVFQTDVTGLSPGTTYYFKARADGGKYGTSYGAELNFTTDPLAPEVDTGGTIDVMTNAAILEGSLDSKGSASSVNVYFSYGTYPNSYSENTTQQALDGPENFQAQLTGLDAFKTYYYRAYGDGGSSGTGSGVERAFTTGKHAPIASTADAGSITAGSAVLNGNLISVGSSLSDNVSFQYGTSHRGPYLNVTTPQAQSVRGAFQASISGLSAHTAYYYRAVANGGIYGAGYGREMSFITLSPPPPPPPPPPTPPTPNPPTPLNPLTSMGGQTSHGSSVTGPATTTQPVQLPNVVVQSASLSAGKVAPGDPVEVTANVANRGTVNGSTTIKLYVNGEEDSIQGVTVESGRNRPVYFTVSRSRPGTYDVYVGSVQAGSFVVADSIDPDNILFISLTLIFFSLVLGIIYIWRKRQQEY